MEQTIHGVLVEVFGVGVLITGKAGVGKSECALELLSRGHRLTADDVIIVKITDEKIIGSPPERFEGLLEIRDLGIFDTRNVFNHDSFICSSEITICIELSKDKRLGDRLRIGAMGVAAEVCGHSIPKLSLKVERGRNIAVLIETAVKLFKVDANTENALLNSHDKLISSGDPLKGD